LHGPASGAPRVVTSNLWFSVWPLRGLAERGWIDARYALRPWQPPSEATAGRTGISLRQSMLRDEANDEILMSMKKKMKRRMWGVTAIEFAEANGCRVNRFPVGDLPRAEGLSVAEARAYIAAGGSPRDIYADVETFEF